MHPFFVGATMNIFTSF